jgi:thioredoxin-like negative regulator of GroEL
MKMFERIIVLGILLIVISMLQRKFRTGKVTNSLQLPGNITLKDSSLPTVLYFWTEQCVQCKNSQKPVLNNLKKENNNFNLVNINAVEQKHITSLFNIRTVPSTIIFSKDGESRFVNNGYANESELARQINMTLGNKS